MKIGIIGVGFVGGTHLKAFQLANMDTAVFDIKYPESKIEDVLDCDVTFVALPSPTKDGQQDLSILESTLTKLSELKYEGVLCIKSTVLPMTTYVIKRSFPNLKITHSPEFLKERTALSDFMIQTSVVVGGNECDTAKVVEAYQLQRQRCGLKALEAITPKDPSVSEMTKYMHNTFLALKVAYANQFAMACKHINVDYDEVKQAAVSQGVIGESHLNVPGYDGKVGYSGTCFPKDVRALLSVFRNLTILREADNFNHFIRPHDENCKPIPIIEGQ